MKIYLNNQEDRLEKHLDEFVRESVMPYDRNRLTEKITTVKLDTATPLNMLDLRFFFNYNIFPPSIMTFRTQWQLENRDMATGDTIVQQVFIPPFKALSQKIIFGVRINRIIDESTRKGFSYETLNGHAERGESTFTVEEIGDNIMFKIHTFSRPASSFVNLLGSWLAVPYQAYCTRKALENVKRQIEG